MSSRSIRCVVVIWSVTVGPVAAWAQTAGSPPSTIQVTDAGILKVTPDEAQIEIGVTTRADSSQAAAAQNARQARAVMDALRAATGSSATIETVSYMLVPDVQQPRDGGDTRISGYTATNIVRITASSSRVSEVIDAGLKAGANRIHRVTFTLADEQAASAKALRTAVENATTRAKTLADALGVSIVRVRSASTGEQPVVQPFDASLARADQAGASTPILPGTVEIRAVVTLTLEVANIDREAASVR
jgi:uncharacterized protein YggE